MAEVVWTLGALQDMEDIAEFIAKDSAKYASKTVKRFFEESEILTTNIRAGRMVPEFAADNLREIVVGSYRIVYAIVSEERVNILTIHHGKRLLGNNPVFFE